MEAASLSVTPEVAYRAFCEIDRQRLWVPGLKKVKVVRADANGRALEVFYEFGESLAYALVYAWDDAQLKARWVPSSGVRDGVSGSVWFEATPGGCLMHYHLEALKGRPTDHEKEVVRGFREWLNVR